MNTNFTKLYDGVFNLKKINPSDMIILSIILSYDANNDSIFFSDKWISEKTNGHFSIQKVKRVIKKLKALNYISTITIGNKKEIDDKIFWGGKTRTIFINPDVIKIIEGEDIIIKPLEPIKAIKNEAKQTEQPSKEATEQKNEIQKLMSEENKIINDENKLFDLKLILESVIDDSDIVKRYYNSLVPFRTSETLFTFNEASKLIHNKRYNLRGMAGIEKPTSEIIELSNKVKNLTKLKNKKTVDNVIQLNPIQQNLKDNQDWFKELQAMN